jgi:KDO2-lipid IV(A) lauroyltransferase
VQKTLPQSSLEARPGGRRLRRHERQALASRGQKLRWRIESWGVRLLLGLLRGRRHRRVQRTIQRTVGLAQPLLADRLATASSNLERVYGDGLAAAERQRLARQSLESFFLSCLESIIEPVDAARITVEGEGVGALLQPQAGQGAIVASLHLGCWDLALRWLSEQRDDLVVIYRPAHNPEADRLLNAARSANSHCRWISQFDRRAMLTSLLRGHCLVVMTDLYGGRNPVTSDVLGLETHVAAGPLSLGQRTGTPLFPVAHVRERDGRFRVIIGAPLQPQPGAEGLNSLAEALSRWQEPWIQAYPEQYYWINRRWRAGDGSGRRLRQLPPPGRD